MQIEFRPAPDLANRIARSDGVARLLGAIALHVAREAQRRVPVRTGNLRRSIVAAVIDENGVPVGVVRATASYAAFVEFGTRFMAARPYLRSALGTVGNFLSSRNRGGVA